MKKTTLVILMLSSLIANAQHPVKWNFKSEKSGEQTSLNFAAAIEKGWHIYSQYTPDGGPLPMLFTFDSSQCFLFVEKVVEPAPIEEFDSVFGLKVKYLEGPISLHQNVKITKSPCKISGRIEYQACKDICIPLDTTFVITVK